MKASYHLAIRLKRYGLFIISLFFAQYLFSQAPTITSFSPTTAGEGDSVIITGTNFSYPTYVSFGGNQVSSTVLSSTTIKASIATGNTGDVTVQNDSGSASLAGFTYNSNPIITSVVPDTAGVGQAVIITGKYLLFGTIQLPPTITFGGVTATSVTKVVQFSTVSAIVGNGASGIISLTTPFGTTTYPKFVFESTCVATTDSVYAAICSSQAPYVWNGKSYTSSGTYNDTLANSGGCDSIVTLYLTVKPSSTSTTNLKICSSQTPYVWNGKSYTSTSIYNDTLANSVGCDSIATLNLTVSPSPAIPTGMNESRQCYGTVLLGVTMSGGVIDTAIRWYSDTALTTQVGTGSNFTTPPINTTTNYYVIERNAAECATSPVTVTATVNSGVPAPTVNSIVNYQQNATASALTAVASQGDTLLWYTTAVGGTGSLTAPIPSTTIIGTITYYVSQKNGCESPRADISVVVEGLIPTITSFSPASGAIGTIVAITGTNFSTAAANNIVYFGAVRAPVTNVNANTLTVTVPVSTTYTPISVTVNGLTAYAAKPFIVTFAGAQSIFTPNSFAAKIDSTTGNTPLASSIADIDGDGKPDMVIINDSDNTVSVYRNTSTGNMISFAPRVNFATGSLPYALSTADVDGDGKLDILVANSVDSTISVYRNTSVVGSISFAARVNYKTGVNPRSVTTSDLDGDGRPDMAVGNYGDTTVWVYRNIGGIGLIAFDTAIKLNAKVGKPTHADLYSFSIVDVDGDGKPDIATETAAYGFLSVFRNTSSLGIISFAPRVDIATEVQTKAVYMGDLDGDGKPDAIVANTQDSSISVFKNISTPGSVAFSGAINYSTGGLPRGIQMNDLDGDGKPDIAIANSGSNSISVFKNTSTTGTISLAARIDYPAGIGPHDISLGDLDGDGKPDMITPNQNSYTVSILRNQIGEAVPASLCPPVGSKILVSYLRGTTYQWQLNTGSGFTNISNNNNYIGTDADSLQVDNIPSSWYGYQYRCVVDGTNGDVYSLKISDVWTGAGNDTNWMDAANWSCGTVPDNNTDVIINSGTAVLSASTTVRSLVVNPTASFTITIPYNLIITH